MAVPLFPGQRPNERIYLLVRRHWLILAQPLVVSLLLLLVPIVARFLVGQLSDTALADPAALGTIVFRLGTVLFYLFLLVFMFHHWIDYYHDYWIISDQRVVSIEQSGIFDRKVSQVDMNHIQDASAQVRGVIPTFFHYGDVVIQSAGEREHFVFEQVPDPNTIVAMMMDIHARAAPPIADQLQAVQQGLASAAPTVSAQPPVQPAPPSVPPARIPPWPTPPERRTPPAPPTPPIPPTTS